MIRRGERRRVLADQRRLAVQVPFIALERTDDRFGPLPGVGATVQGEVQSGA